MLPRLWQAKFDARSANVADDKNDKNMKEQNTPIINLQEKSLEQFIDKRRPPIEIRDKLDIGYSYENQVVEIFEIRPRWNNPSEKLNIKIARAKFIKSKNLWKIYWMRASGKWELSEPTESVKELSAFLQIVDEDKYGCFWG